MALWCQDNLSLNASKTKELIVDYRSKRGEHVPIHINRAVPWRPNMVHTHPHSRGMGTRILKKLKGLALTLRTITRLYTKHMHTHTHYIHTPTHTHTHTQTDTTQTHMHTHYTLSQTHTFTLIICSCCSVLYFAIIIINIIIIYPDA